MTCFFCKGDMESGFTTYTAELDNRVVVIRNVPCMKCTQCGEMTINGTTMKKLETIIKKCSDIMTEVAIINFNNTAT